MEALLQIVNNSKEALSALAGAGIICDQPNTGLDPFRWVRACDGRLVRLSDDRLGSWYVDIRPTSDPQVLVALEHAFAQAPARECVMDGQRCLHWELPGDVLMVATSAFVQLSAPQPVINCEPDPKRMVS